MINETNSIYAYIHFNWNNPNNYRQYLLILHKDKMEKNLNCSLSHDYFSLVLYFFKISLFYFS